MKDTMKRKLKKTIYAALVLSYILIITTVTTQAASGTVYWSDHTTLEYTEQDGREVTYPTYSNVSVTYTNTQVVNMEILLTNPDETVYMYAMQDLSGFTITYNGTSYGAQFYQALYEVGIRDSVLNRYINAQINTKVEYLGSSQMRIKVRFGIPDNSGTSMYTLLSNFHNSNTEMTDSYVTSWGMIILANAVIREQVSEGTVESRDIFYNGSYKTPIEIDNMITQNFNGTMNNIYDELVGEGDRFEGGTINPMPELNDAEDEAIGVYDDIFDRYEQEMADYITNGNGVVSDELFGAFQANVIVTRILGMPFIIIVVPIATFMIILKNLLL